MSHALTSLSVLSGIAAGTVILAAATDAVANTCRPAIKVTSTHHSPMQEMRRTWTAVIEVDASRCASGSGPFEIGVVRWKENGIDLPFTESFTWRPGRTEISLDLWADEAIGTYAIGAIAPCPCRR